MESPIAVNSLVLGSLPARHARYRPRHTAVVVAVVLREKDCVGADELKDWINARVAAKYQRVERVIVMDEFPRNAAGKTLKRAMRAPFWEGRAQKI